MCRRQCYLQGPMDPKPQGETSDKSLTFKIVWLTESFISVKALNLKHLQETGLRVQPLALIARPELKHSRCFFEGPGSNPMPKSLSCLRCRGQVATKDPNRAPQILLGRLWLG